VSRKKQSLIKKILMGVLVVAFGFALNNMDVSEAQNLSKETVDALDFSQDTLDALDIMGEIMGEINAEVSAEINQTITENTQQIKVEDEQLPAIAAGTATDDASGTTQ